MKMKDKRKVVSWVERTRQGDQQARESLFRFYSKRLGSWFGKNLRDPFLAEDLLQETLLEGLKGIEKVRDPWRFDAWICRIARNLAVNAFKRKKPLSLSRVDLQELEAHGDGRLWGPQVGESRFVAAVWAAVAALPGDEGAAIREHHGNGVPLKDLARRQGVSLSGMKMRLLRARQRLRPVLLRSLEAVMDPNPRSAGAGSGGDEMLVFTNEEE